MGNQGFTHNLETLVRLAGLQSELEAQTRASDAFQEFWNNIRGEKVDWRYDSPIGEAEAASFVQSVADATDGILPWLQAHW